MIEDDGTITDANDRFRSYFDGEIEGKKFQEISHYKGVKRALRECLKNGSSQYRNQGKLNNEYRVSSVRLSSYPSEGKTKIVIIVTDETKLANIFQGLAHDMKHPLGLVLKSVENAILRVKRGLSVAGVKQDLDLVHAGIVAYQSFVLSLNARAHIDTAKSRPDDEQNKQEYFSLNEVVTELDRLYSSSSYVLGVKVGFTIEGEIKIHARQRTLEAVIRNLISNAIKACEYNTAADNVIKFHARRDGSDVVIEVSDTGVGIPNQDKERLFDLSTQFGGTGSYITACFVKDEEGHIQIQSPGKLGSGTTVALRIPA